MDGRRQAVDEPDSPAWKLRIALLIGAVAVSVLYLPLNQSLTDGTVLYTELDRELPVAPLLTVPYLAELPIFWLSFAWAMFRGRGFTAFALSLIIVGAISCAVFLIFPTYAPRPSTLGSSWTWDVVRYVYDHDRPYNDLPSMHASSSTLLALWAFASHLRWRLAFAALSLSVVAATVLIKQHSLAGTFSGVVLALAAWLVVTRVVIPRMPGKSLIP